MKAIRIHQYGDATTLKLKKFRVCRYDFRADNGVAVGGRSRAWESKLLDSPELVSIGCVLQRVSAHTHHALRLFRHHVAKSPFGYRGAVIVVAAVFLFRRRAAWLFIGAPIAFYWPVWLLVHGYPPCWYMGNCV